MSDPEGLPTSINQHLIFFGSFCNITFKSSEANAPMGRSQIATHKCRVCLASCLLPHESILLPGLPFDVGQDGPGGIEGTTPLHQCLARVLLRMDSSDGDRRRVHLEAGGGNPDDDAGKPGKW